MWINMIQIQRSVTNYEYDTPTRCRIVFELFLKNVGDETVKEWYYLTFEFFPGLIATDSKGRKMKILPSQLLAREVLEKAKEFEKDGVPVYPIGIEFNEALKPGMTEDIKLEYIFAFSRNEVFKREWTRVGFTEYKIGVKPLKENREATQYIGIFLPKEYYLDISLGETEKYIVHRDENSAIFRFPELEKEIVISWAIHVPNRNVRWIQIGFWFSIISPICSLILYFFTYNLTVCNGLILGTLAMIVAMRVWIFYSVELLDELNWWYIGFFILNLILMAGIYYFSIVTTMQQRTIVTNSTTYL